MTEEEIDNDAIEKFSEQMKIKMAKNRGKGRYGWYDKEYVSNKYLSAMLIAHVKKGDPLDVAIIAMMLHQRGERILS